MNGEKATELAKGPEMAETVDMAEVA